ncbi:uncharacterized protein LOC128726801 [Anopheles nili]|uniref:uncharacterized protein LOC128726801 n=1 Tax=Anopheles nili TaxID=185578 RepID=UPI00237C39D9|nr:uncharacterized protein LOC128726801 [Anopheles nili]
MKLKVQMTPMLMLAGVALCSMLFVVQSAPAPEQASQDSLLVLPVMRETVGSEPVAPFEPIDPVPAANVRSKRAIIFRPLFVYRQQQIKKQQVLDGSNPLKTNPDKADLNYYAGQLPTRQ